MKTGLTLLLTFVLLLSEVLAQQSFNTTGAMSSGNGGSVSYSLGQIVYKIQTGVNTTMFEGVQQPYEISIESDIDQHNNNNNNLFEILAYPNPSIDFLTLLINDIELKDLSYKLYDIGGKLLLYDIISDNQTKIMTKKLLKGVYFLKVIKSNKNLKTFKIMKNV